jgi:hypothetical protein
MRTRIAAWNTILILCVTYEGQTSCPAPVFDICNHNRYCSSNFYENIPQSHSNGIGMHCRCSRLAKLLSILHIDGYSSTRMFCMKVRRPWEGHAAQSGSVHDGPSPCSPVLHLSSSGLSVPRPRHLQHVPSFRRQTLEARAGIYRPPFSVHACIMGGSIWGPPTRISLHIAGRT